MRDFGLPPQSDSLDAGSQPTESDLLKDLEFLELTEADAKNLRALLPVFRAYSDQFVESFYEHLLSFADSERFLRDPILVERLKKAQFEHFETMLEARWDAGFVKRRQRVGHAHAEVGIEPKLFLGAYNQYVQHCFENLATDERDDSQTHRESMRSLWKAIFLDVGLTLDAYFIESTKRMRRALDMFWKANTELRQFAELASHDLKTPLATVLNLCDEVLDEFGDSIPEEAEKLISAARARSFRMSAMIDELLAATVTESLSTPEDETSSETIIREAAERIRSTLEEKQIELRIPDRLPYVVGDHVRIREAFYNLFSNAAKFIDRTPGKIVVEVEVGEREAVFSIADNGPGIPAEELERVFVPFRRLPMHRDRPGSGLGLYFTKNLVEQQGGRVWATSEPGDGSCFFIALRRSGVSTANGNS